MAITVTRSRALAAALVLLVLLAVAGRRLAATGAASEAAPAAARLQPVATAPAPKVVVHVAGAVRRPGLYRLRDGSRVADAISRAGGATGKADTSAVNLAAPVVDGSQVLVPGRPVAGASAPVPAAGAAPAKVSLAGATLEQLDTLPGVGPVTAQRILDHREANGPFRSVDDLDAVPGIGPARIEQLRELVTP
jgi:competence protein ComEA